MAEVERDIEGVPWYEEFPHIEPVKQKTFDDALRSAFRAGAIAEGCHLSAEGVEVFKPRLYYLSIENAGWNEIDEQFFQVWRRTL